MSDLPPLPLGEPTRAPACRRRRKSRLRGLAVPAGVVVVFAIGIALGQALHDNPRPGGKQTVIRTIRPASLTAAARTTVTVTKPTDTSATP